MKIVSLGHEFDDDRIHSIRFKSAHTVLEFDVVIYWPDRVLEEYATGSHSYQGKTSLSESQSFRLRDDVTRRLADFEEFIRLGRHLIIIAPSPEYWWVDSGNRDYSGTGRNRQRTVLVDKMSTSDLMPVQLDLVSAHGDEIAAGTSPVLNSFLSQLGDLLFYDAYMTNPIDEPGLMIKRTDHCVGSIGRIDNATLIVLPQINLEEPYPSDDEDRDEADGEDELVIDPDEPRVVEALLRLINAVSSPLEELPAWSDQFAIDEESDFVSELKEAAEKVAEAQNQVSALEARLAELRTRKLLFTGSGSGLERAAEQAFKALGFGLEETAPGRTDRVLSRKKQELVVEIKGVEKSAAEKHAAQLQKWISERHAETGKEPKGVLVVNAWRNLPLDERVEAAFPAQMLPYAQRQRHCLMTGIQLLCAWLDIERDANRSDKIADSISQCVGIWDQYTDWRDYILPIQVQTELEE